MVFSLSHEGCLNGLNREAAWVQIELEAGVMLHDAFEVIWILKAH